MLKYKIVLGGAKNVGKSSLIARFCDNTFNDVMMDTIGVDFKRKLVKVDMNGSGTETNVDLVIWDFGGEEKYRALFPNYAKNASATLILFDLTRPETLDDVKNWVEIMNENANEDAIKVLIGSKVDLVNERKVTKAKIKEFCKSCRIDPIYIETSAKTGENVEDAFLKATKMIIDSKLQECKYCHQFLEKELRSCRYCGKALA